MPETRLLIVDDETAIRLPMERFFAGRGFEVAVAASASEAMEAYRSAVPDVVLLDIKLTNPSGAIESPLPPVSKKGNPKLRWEGHTERGWVALICTDGTFSLTQDGNIEFQVPADAKSAMINGTSGGWIRARLTGGPSRAPKSRA